MDDFNFTSTSMPPLVPLVPVPTYNIGLLDLETWDRGERAAVMEIGALVYNIQNEGEYWRLTEEKIQQPNRVLQRFLNFEEQLRLKRLVDVNTVLFHVEQGLQTLRRRGDVCRAGW